MRRRFKDIATLWRALWADRGLATKFVLAYAFVGFLVVASLVWQAGSQLARAIEEEVEHELELRALIIAGTLGSDVEDMVVHGRSPREVLNLMQQFSEGTDTRISFYDRSLRLIFSTDPAVQPHTAEMTAEMKAALALQEQHDIRVDPWSQETRLFVAAPVLHEEELLGVVQISIPWAIVQARINAQWTALIVAGILAVLGNVLVSFWLTRSIVRPLRLLTQTAREIAGGRMDRRVPVHGRDEVGMLAVAFNEMAEQLQQRIERERLFIGNASHELRSPLTSLKLRLEMLQDPSLPPDRRQRYLEEAYREAERLQQLADRLLDFTRLQVRPETETAKPLDLAPVVGEVVDSFAFRAAQAGVRLRYEPSAQALTARVSEEGLRTIVQNLVDNALKYTPAGGEVTVRLFPDDGQVVLQVEDTGEGIPPEHLPYIFEPFYRANHSRSGKHSAGLGLSIAKRLVETFGGTIRVQSTVGQGTTFTVSFPSAVSSEELPEGEKQAGA